MTPDRPAGRWWWPSWIALAVAVVARFATVAHLWLDEALTVNIARLPLGDISEALRHDGSPPFYYLALHAWMAVFGDGDVAVRAFSGVLAVAALPLAWLVGRRLGGRPAAWGALLLLASSPFAIRYATEARMYSLIIVLVLGGFLALDTVVERRSLAASIALGAVTGALLLTHYWSFFLVAAVVGSLVVAAVRARRQGNGPRCAGALQALLAIAVGSLLFLPWIPAFLYQAANTGTPWGRLPPPRVPFDVVFQFAAAQPDLALPLGLLLYALVVLGIFGVPAVAGVVGLDLRGRPPGRALTMVAVATLVIGVAAGRLTGAAFAVRYAAVVFPLVVLIAGLGYAVLAPSRAGPWALGLAVVLGFSASIPFAAGDRTSAGVVAEALRANAQPGDVVAYCPDQLGPGREPAPRRRIGAGPGHLSPGHPAPVRGLGRLRGGGEGGRARRFRPYAARASRPRPRRVGGVGAQLPHVRREVSAHDGRAEAGARRRHPAGEGFDQELRAPGFGPLPARIGSAPTKEQIGVARAVD